MTGKTSLSQGRGRANNSGGGNGWFLLESPDVDRLLQQRLLTRRPSRPGPRFMYKTWRVPEALLGNSPAKGSCLHELFRGEGGRWVKPSNVAGTLRARRYSDGGWCPENAGSNCVGTRGDERALAAAGRHAHSLGRRATRNSDGKGGVRPRSTMLLLRAPLMRASLGWGARAWRGPG